MSGPARGRGLWVFGALLVLSFCNPCFIYGSAPPVNHSQPQLVWPGTVEFVVQTDNTVRAVRFYFLRPGLGDFQMRFMESAGGGRFTYRFDASTLHSLDLQYYFEIFTQERMTLYPENAPITPLMVTGDRKGIKLELAEVPVRLEVDDGAVSTGSITFNGSLEYLVKHEGEEEEKVTSSNEQTSGDEGSSDDEEVSTPRFGDDDFLADVNLRLTRSWEKGDNSINFDINLGYTSHPLEDEQEGSVSYILLEAKRPHHLIRVGDLEVVASQFVGESLNTRGIDYQYSRGRFTGELFFMNSRAVTVFEDSLPDTDNHIVGTKLGVDVITDHLHVDFYYLQGRDDPSISSTGSGIDLEIYEGNLLAIAPTVSFFDESLQFIGEYAESTSENEISSDTGTDTAADSGTTNTTTAESESDPDELRDSAWRAGTKVEKGGWMVSGFYKYVGADFQSLGNPNELYFTTNRRGYELDFEYSSDRWMVLVEWEHLVDNLDDDAAMGWSVYQNATIIPQWQITDNLVLSISHTNGQERSYEDEDYKSRTTDLMLSGWSADIDYSFSDNSAVQISATRDEIESFDTPESDSVITTVTFNYSYYDDRLQFYPSLSYSQTDIEEELTETLNLYVSGEYFIIPEVLSISTNDSLTWTKGEVTARTRLISLTANINWHLGWIGGSFSDTVLSLVGEYEDDDQEETSTDSYTISTKLDFLF